jgi:23S rRNA pseudouridine1911/1915/1917 synthase
MQKVSLEAQVNEVQAGSRLDQAAAELFPDYSRARLQKWIKQGKLLVNGEKSQSKQKLLGDERLSINAILEVQKKWQAEELPLDIVHEDADILVLNKAAGIVVHPAAGNHSGTLLNALLHHCPELMNIPRAGIIHRLDKDTSGLLVVAKTLSSHQTLVADIQARELNREYQALVCGLVTAGGQVDQPLGRHPVQRKKRAVVHGSAGKPAMTHYRVLQKFRAHTLLQVKLETGRTHQIRVHMAHLGYPLLGDPLYGGRLKIPKAASPALIGCLKTFKRQALHAWKLGFMHPSMAKYMEWEAPSPTDMQSLISILAEDNTHV